MSDIREALVAREVRTSDGRTLTPAQVAAHDGIQRRLTWPSMHWGVEGVHPDAWPHIAMAAADAILAAGWTPPRERTAGGDLELIRRAIREVKAEAWDEVADYLDRTNAPSIAEATRRDNPYRKEQP